ncbi:hypothetical protein SAY86_007380 [Trapa natans]|uniref:Uncharacterized protein n=1 Tax=Trapa natans TaxID=22666 RepID=A0AAN7LLR4_TRANT|nr:hypothetical protein SAY86_007380 [Trapa natans]
MARDDRSYYYQQWLLLLMGLPKQLPPPPLPLQGFVLLVMLCLSWYANYESMFENIALQLKLFLLLCPLLLLLVHLLLAAADDHPWAPILASLPEHDSLHRADGSPWGRCCHPRLPPRDGFLSVVPPPTVVSSSCSVMDGAKKECLLEYRELTCVVTICSGSLFWTKAQVQPAELEGGPEQNRNLSGSFGSDKDPGFGSRIPLKCLVLLHILDSIGFYRF